MVRALLLASLLVACSQETKPLTQLVLVADTDIASVDLITFEASARGSDAQVSQVAQAVRADGPSYVTLVRDSGPLGPITVAARGLSRGVQVIERVQVVSFVVDETRVVRLDLLARCLGVRCGSDQTCAESGCHSQVQPELPVWTGTPDALDASVPDAGSSDASTSTDAASPDAGPDAGADGGDGGSVLLTECGDAGLVDLQNDPTHCGRCEIACVQPPSGQHVAATCVRGLCRYACVDPWDSCDNRTDNGCETNLQSDPAHCGSCPNSCRGQRQCLDGECR